LLRSRTRIEWEDSLVPFTFEKATSEIQAIVAGARGGRFIAGGTTLVDLMREGIEQPQLLIDINALPLHEIRATAKGLTFGALVRMSELANHPIVVAEYPVISEALLDGASPQLRNMASIGGNLLQRTRCPYFRDVGADCNKRSPGSGCDAIAGFNRTHAIFGTSPSCIAAHPSDVAVALVALDASVRIRGPTGERVLPVEDLYCLPGETPDIEHNLAAGELIVSVDVPSLRQAGHSLYLKVRDRASYAFALVSAAVVLEVDVGTIRTARIAAGGVGTKPWRFRTAEATLIGRPPSAEAWRQAADCATEGAHLYSGNAFKAELLRRTLARALETVWTFP
jgi:xanthine dehydrogenase YagS FAD-binding subunit